MVHDVWVEVDLAALKHNFAQVRGILAPQVKVAAVVKSNGFGHGYVEPSRAFIDAGADMVAVTRMDEALILRRSGIEAPILLFAPIQRKNASEAVDAGLEMTVSSEDLVRSISDAAQRAGKTARIHIKVDTGMGRLGVPRSEAITLVELAASLPSIDVAGIYTHFATATDASLESCAAQLKEFNALLADLNARGLNYGAAHAANSAAILRLPDSHLDMVRPGTILYGQYPSANVPRKLDLKQTWKLKARICEVKTVPSGSPIGYGAEFTTKRTTRTAVVPIGYADGYTMAPEGPIYRQSILKLAARKMKRQLRMEVRGKWAPVIGRVAMQIVVLDVTDILGVEVGDEVIVPAMRIPTNPLIPRIYA